MNYIDNEKLIEDVKMIMKIPGLRKRKGDRQKIKKILTINSIYGIIFMLKKYRK
jgi:hypothetical protein